MIQEHPSLVQAASYIAAAIAKEGGGEGPSSRHNPSLLVGDDYESDDELRGMEPGVRFTFCHVLHQFYHSHDFFQSIRTCNFTYCSLSGLPWFLSLKF